jgi:type I restriction enzyme S subunit
MTEQSPGLLGSPIFIPESDKYLHNQRLGLIRNLDTTNLIPEYLFHFFNLEKVRTIISITSTGTKVKHTSPNKIRAIPISLPTIDEQKKIVTILFSIDQKLTAEQSRKEALDTLFTSLLHDLMTTKIRVAPAETA